MDFSSVLGHPPSGSFQLPKERNCSHHGTVAWVTEAISSYFRMRHPHKWNFSCQLYCGNFLPHADKFLLPSHPRLKLYLLSSVSSITDFTFTHSPSLSHSRTFISLFGFKTILEILHTEVSISEDLEIKITTARSSSTNTERTKLILKTST